VRQFGRVYDIHMIGAFRRGKSGGFRATGTQKTARIRLQQCNARELSHRPIPASISTTGCPQTYGTTCRQPTIVVDPKVLEGLQAVCDEIVHWARCMALKQPVTSFKNGGGSVVGLTDQRGMLLCMFVLRNESALATWSGLNSFLFTIYI